MLMEVVWDKSKNIYALYMPLCWARIVCLSVSIQVETKFVSHDIPGEDRDVIDEIYSI